MADSTWLSTTNGNINGFYNVPANWNNGVPSGTAFFVPPTVGLQRSLIELSADTTVGGWKFFSSQPFVFTTGSYNLTFTGAGIENLLDVPNVIVVDAILKFENGSSAGFTKLEMDNSFVSYIYFRDTSTAGRSIIEVNNQLGF